MNTESSWQALQTTQDIAFKCVSMLLLIISVIGIIYEIVTIILLKKRTDLPTRYKITIIDKNGEEKPGYIRIDEKKRRLSTKHSLLIYFILILCVSLVFVGVVFSWHN